MLGCEMTKEYLKMSDVFGEIVQPGRFNYAMANPKATYAAHAINSHDELVAEVERLRGAIKDAFIDGCQVGWDMTGEGYNAEYGGPDDGRLHEEFSAIFDERYTDMITLA